MMSSKRKWILFGIAAVLLFAATGVAFANWLSGPKASGGELVDFSVGEGASGSDIAVELERAGVIDSELAFRIFLTLRGGGDSLKAGDYQLREKMPHSKILEILRGGPDADFVRLTIPEGLTVEQTAELVGSKTHIASEQFLEATRTESQRSIVFPEDLDTTPLLTGPLEGFLFPDTYFIGRSETAESLVRKLIATFETATKDIDWSKAEELGITPYQAVVVASLVEEETKVDEERPVVSSVIFNRLSIGMMLGIDATVQYLVKRYDGSPLTADDLATVSPYNTRLTAGLPPGPISSPGLASIKAALEPAETDFLYYVLTPDCRTHFFTSDFAAFSTEKLKIPSNC
jgi:UPF0755 protein